MKVLILLVFVVIFGSCKQSVTDEDSSTLKLIKDKARELHKKFDADGDGSVSFEEFKEGVKNGLGFGDDDDSLPNTDKIYEKYLFPKNEKKTFTEEDFEEIFRDFSSRGKSEGKEFLDGMKKKKDSMVEEAQKKASEIFDSFDEDKDGHVSFEELKTGLKNKLFGEEEDKDEQSLSDYAKELYEKYVESDDKDKDRKHFSKQDFYQIYQDRNDKSLLEKAKEKANEIHKKLDTNGDGKVTMEELKKGMAEGIGFDDDEEDNDEESIKEKVENLYEKYIKPKGEDLWLSLEDVGEIISEKWRQGKEMAEEKWEEGKKIVGEKLSEGKEGAREKIKESKRTIGEKLKDGKDAAGEKAEEIKDSISDMVADKIDEGSDVFKQFKAKANEIYDKVDTNKDSWISLAELKEGFKTIFNLGEDQQDESLTKCIQDLYQRHRDAGWGDQLKLAKDDYVKLMYRWKEQCPASDPEDEISQKEL